MKYLFLIFKGIKFIAILMIQSLNSTLKKNFKGRRAFKKMLNEYGIDKNGINELSKEYSNIPKNILLLFQNKI